LGFVLLGENMIVHEMKPYFRDRQDAGQKIAEKLKQYRGGNSLVLAIPHGGVPVAVEVAKGLEAGLDVIVVRKIPIPSNTEAGYGAVADDGTILLNEPLVNQLGLTSQQIQHHAKRIKDEIDTRITLYRKNKSLPSLEEKTVFIIDDGLASGFTMLAAVNSVRRRKAGKVIVAVPVASSSAYHLVREKADELISLIIAESPYFAVASFYHHWYDLSEKEAIDYLEQWRDNILSKKSIPKIS
jgi:predicted phosphoribosyltransferase